MIQKITNENFEDITNSTDKLVVLDFFATWCNPCTQFAPILEAVNKEFDENIIVGKINVDEENDLAENFDVESIPTLFFMKNGNVVSKNVGVYKEDELKNIIKRLI